MCLFLKSKRISITKIAVVSTAKLVILLVRGKYGNMHSF